MKISTLSDSDSASPKSSSIGGSGRKSTARTSVMPTAKAMSLLPPSIARPERAVGDLVPALIPKPHRCDW